MRRITIFRALSGLLNMRSYASEQAQQPVKRVSYELSGRSQYRLTDADYPLSVAANNETFGYDGVGNRTGHTQTPEEGEAEAITSTYNNLNQLVSQTKDGVETTFTYNPNGHTATKTTGSETTEYIYNHEERLIAVKKNGTTVGEYAYNPLGQRIKKTVNGQTTWHLYNDEGLAAEYNQQGQLIAEYQFTPYSTWMTDPLFQRRGGQVYYYQNDHLGTPQRMINANGEVVWEARYEAFGEAEIINGAVTNNLRFPGQYFDSETGLYHNYFRDYDSEVGRYVQGDPIGFRGGLNYYLYAKSSPFRYKDSLGLQYQGGTTYYDELGLPPGHYHHGPPDIPMPGPSLPTPRGFRGAFKDLMQAIGIVHWAVWSKQEAERSLWDKDLFPDEIDEEAAAEHQRSQMQKDRSDCEAGCIWKFPHEHEDIQYCPKNFVKKEECKKDCWDDYHNKVNSDPTLGYSR